MMDIKQRLSDILKLNLPKEYTSVSYALMVDGEIVAADWATMEARRKIRQPSATPTMSARFLRFSAPLQ